MRGGDANAARRLRKGASNERAMYLGMQHGEEPDGGWRSARRLSLASIPPVFTRSRGLSVGNSPSSNIVSGNGTARSSTRRNDGRSGAPSSSAGSCTHGDQTVKQSPEKHRGRMIHQNRRKMSWIDEDALHGPRISPKKDTKKKKKTTNWFRGNGLTRTLSRHLSFRGYHAPELARSPTLPCAETGQGQGFGDGTPLETRHTASTENGRREREFEAELDVEPGFPVRQSPQRGASFDAPVVTNPQTASAGSYQFPMPGTALPCPQCHNNMVINAAQELAGQARVPNLEARADGQRQSHMQQGATDAELVAILRRTAERLQDGNRSVRRQTMMLPSSSSSSRLQERAGQVPNEECVCGLGAACSCNMVPSPTKSQKSAPAVMLYSELEGSSPVVQRGTPQSNAPWQTHRRSHTRRISHISQVSQVSMLSDADSLVMTPSRRGSQADVIQTALSSPSRTAHTSPSYQQQLYSPVSEQSSALSTVYSEEEGSHPTGVAELDDTTREASEMERRDGAQGTRNSQIGVSPLHLRRGTPERRSPTSTHNAHTFASMGITQTATQDPFMTCATPTRPTPQRLSRVFTPLPAELPGDAATRSPIDDTEQVRGSPTRSRSRRSVIPPPRQLRPDMEFQAVEQHDLRFQAQQPSRQPSLAVSESGLSSVYDSYRYSRSGDSIGDSEMPEQLSTGTIITVPPTEELSTKSRRDEDIASTVSTKSPTEDHKVENNGAGASQSGHMRVNRTRSRAYTHLAHPLRLFPTDSGSMPIRYPTADATPRSQPTREISLSGVSELSAESTYSQEEDGRDKLAPLIPFRPAMGASGRHGHARRVTSTVAELRRMNSQVSCVSGYSTATTTAGATEMLSPTLPALRGGGFSPGKKEMGNGGKNYLSLGSHQTRGDDERNSRYADGEVPDGGSGRDSDESNERETASAERLEDGAIESLSGGRMDHITVRRGSVRRSRRHTVVKSFEQDLDRARQVLRESRVYNLQTGSDISSKTFAFDSAMAQATESTQSGA